MEILSIGSKFNNCNAQQKIDSFEHLRIQFLQACPHAFDKIEVEKSMQISGLGLEVAHINFLFHTRKIIPAYVWVQIGIIIKCEDFFLMP